MRFSLTAIVLFSLWAYGSADLNGTVRDDAGRPVADALVRLVDASDPTRVSDAYTGSDGRYLVKLPGSTHITPRRFQGGAGPISTRRGFSGMEFFLRRSGWTGPFVYNLRGRLLGAGPDYEEEGAASDGQAGLVAGFSEAGRPPLEKRPGGRPFHVTLWGKGVYPWKAAGILLSDGETRDFQLKRIDLWDSARAVLRGNLANSRHQFEAGKRGRVAFLGGSITFNPGWRDSVQAYLRKRYPQAAFEFINAGIPSVGSDMHAFRLGKDVFHKGKVDLLFVESAVNDTTNGVPSRERTRAYEGIVRQALRHNPDIDVVFLYFADNSFYPQVKAGKPISLVTDYEQSGRYYGVSSINLAQSVAERFTWSQFGGDMHPGAFGQGLYFAAISRLLTTAWNDTSSKIPQPVPHYLPTRPQDSLCYSLGHFDSLPRAQIVNGWKHVPAWVPVQGGTRDGFYKVPVLEATAPGSVLKLAFTGTAIAIVIPAGPDVDMLECSIDGKAMGTRDQFTPWSAGLNIPWTLLFSGDLAMGPHEITLKTSSQKNPGSSGYACRIIRFAVNGPDQGPAGLLGRSIGR